MRVLVTGGSGYLGVVVCQVLAQAGHTVRCLDVRQPPRALLTEWGAQYVEASLTCVPEVRKALAGCDGVVHLAGLSSDAACRREPQAARLVNLEAALTLAQLAQTQGCRRFVHASSASVYGNLDGAPQSESATPAPMSLYARFKLELELHLNAMAHPGFEVVHLRQATLFGWSPCLRNDLVVNAMTRDAIQGRPIVIRGGGGQWRPFLYVGDAARCFQAALEAPGPAVQGQSFNVGSDAGNLRIRDVARIVRGLYPRAPVVVVPDRPDRRSYQLNCSKVQNQLGWQAEVSVADGVRELGAALGAAEGVAECFNWRSAR